MADRLLKAGAVRPFDLTRDGFVLGEGAGALLLESLGRARARGAHIHAEILGFGYSVDTHDAVTPDPEGIAASRAVVNALSASGLTPEDVDYINVHGTSTPLGDRAETVALKRVFRDRAGEIPLSSPKSMTGHLLGAADSVEAVFTLLAIGREIVPPTINYTTPDPECDLDYTPNRARRHQTRVALKSSFGFGGHAAAVAFAKYDVGSHDPSAGIGP